MEKLIDELCLILETLNSIFNELKDIAKNKQPILIKGNIEGLDNLTKKEQVLIIQVGKLEERRFQIQEALANHFSVRVEDLNISFLIKNISEGEKNKLIKIFDDLNSKMQEVKEINDSNAQLIKQSLDYIEYSINLITSCEEKPTYPDNGVSSKPNNNYARIFDQKI